MGNIPPSTHFGLRQALLERDSADLMTLAGQIEELEAHPAWKALTGMLAEGRETILSRVLIHGRTMEQAGYARQMGYLAGLEESIHAAHTVKEAAAMRQEQLQREAEAERAAREEAIS